MIEATSFLSAAPYPPGETIQELLEERGWTRAELADRLGFSPKHVNELLHGEVAISPDCAWKLSQVLGSTPIFWLNLEAGYRSELARNSQLTRLSQAAPTWLQEFPGEWMAKQGWVKKWSDLAEQTEEFLRFFGVTSVDIWRRHHALPLAAFRAADTTVLQPGAVAAWLCEAERRAMKIPCASYDASKFRQLLPDLRRLSGETRLRELEEQLCRRCATVGVALVLLPAPPGCPANGATLWIEPKRAMMVLSLRYRSNDQFWFTFFHEACHILKHGKKLEFLEGVGGLDLALEKEADDFAQEQLIPSMHSHQLPYLKKVADIVDFARVVGIDPGIVVGRLQREGLLPWNRYNRLKKAYHWEEPAV
jgi:addiction module HigA family antidote